jgi:hypothetical protein
MAYEMPVLCVTLPANADLSANQYEIVYPTTGGYVAISTGRLAKFLGVLQDKPQSSGCMCKVMVSGITKVRAGSSSGLEAAIIKGAYLTSTGGGVYGSSAAADTRIHGMALDACSTFSATTGLRPLVTMLLMRSYVLSS